MVDILLKTSWEDIQYLHSELQILESYCENNQGMYPSQVTSLIAAYFPSVNNVIVDIENIVFDEMTRLKIYSYFTGG